MTEALALAMHRPSSLDDDLYQWSLDAAEMLRKQAEVITQLREALDELMEWQVKNVKKWHNPAYDNAHKALAATEEFK